MLFESPHANLQVICSVTRFKRHPVSGDIVETVPAIWANFGKLGPQYDFINPETGETMQGAEIVGHFFDTDLEAVQNGWDDDDKALVERKLLALCKKEPTKIQQIEREVARAQVPWPAYDEMDAEKIVQLAQVTGLVEATLAYERENRDRQFIVDALTGQAPPVPEPEVPDGGGDSTDPEPVAQVSGRTITV